MSAVPNNSSPARYLDGRVTTASQAELPLMMLDGALRFGRQARQFWDQPAHRAEIDRLLERAIDVVEELARGVACADTDVSKRLAEEYAFAFRRLVFAKFNRDAAALDEALELLAYHRETWRLVCDNLKSQTPESSNASTVPMTPSPVVGAPFRRPQPPTAGGNISLEA